MAKIIGAPTLDDALKALGREVSFREARGERSLVFSEDRLTLLAERAVLNEVGGTFLTEVSTFARFLSGPKVLSKEGSVMVLSELISKLGDKLSFFRERAARAVYETIAQLSASRIGADMLTASAEKTDGILSGKLKDLALLLGEYERYLQEKGLVDENGYLAMLPEKLAREAAGVHVFFFGFQSFTRQGAEGVRAALRSAASVTGIFLAGREEFYTNEGARLFRRLSEEEGEAEAYLVKTSLEKDALLLQKGLFSPDALANDPVPVAHIRRFTAADEAEEYTLVAALIKRFLSRGLRYRDFAVLVPGKESFSPLERAFSAFRIPFFSDRKRPFSEHPFCALVLSLLDAVQDGVLPDEADAVLSNVYFGDGNNYRNYLMKYGGYRGGVRREIKEGDAVKGYRRAELVSARERLLSFLSLFPKKGKGGDFSDGVRALSERADAAKKTEELRARFQGAEREFLKLDPLEGVLKEIDLLARERTFTAREFKEVLENGFKALEISMLPQSADAVFVGDCTESRFSRVRVLFATGLTDALPRVSQDTAVISDRDMEKLSDLKVEIEPAIAQVNARARESFALNLCSFTDELFLSCPMRLNGAETERGEAMRCVEQLFSMPPMPELFPFDCCEEGPAELKLISLKQRFEAGREEDGKKFSALYALLRETTDPERLLSGGEKENVPEAGKLVFAGPVSPTLLESYFACPYAGFATRALRLREREERAVLDADAGTFVHAVLEQVAKRFNSFSSEEECLREAERVGESLLSARYLALLDTAAGAYTGKRLIEEGKTVSLAAFRQLTRSSFRVAETEGRIALPELSLEGKTDRVDVSGDYIRIIDYKTGSFDDSPTAYYTGRRLQLQLYLKGAARGKLPAGAFYFPAADGFSKEGEEKFRMSGFYCGEDEVLSRMDSSLAQGEKSLFFDGKRDGKFTDKGMSREDFEAFLDYALLVSAKAEHEIGAGNIKPSPYEGACAYCKLVSLCGFAGDVRKESAVKCATIAKIVRSERGDS